MNSLDLQNAQDIAKLGKQCATLTSYLPKSYKAIQRECEELLFKQITEDQSIPYKDRLGILQNIKGILKHSQNQSNILEIADRYLSGSNNNNDSTLDEEWFDLFLEECKTVSNEDIQEIWGKILAEECLNPNSIRKRFLMTLKTIDKETALAFNKINNYVTTISFLDEISENNLIINAFDLPKGINLSDIDELEYAGLVNVYIGEGKTYHPDNKNCSQAIISYCDTIIKVNLIDNELPIGQMGLTPDGVALHRIINSEKSIDYLDYLISYYNKYGYVAIIE